MATIRAFVRDRASASQKAVRTGLSRAGIGLKPLAEGNIVPLASQSEVQDAIAGAILRGEAFLVARFGRSELDVSTTMAPNSTLSNRSKVLRCLFPLEGSRFNKSSFSFLGTSGFYPTDDRESLILFSQRYLGHVEAIDVLGSWVASEQLIADRVKARWICRLHQLDPFFASSPWTWALEGKKVLVVSPFKDSILRQYKKRELLFGDRRLLPNFYLECLRPPVTFNTGPGTFETFPDSWFEASDRLNREVSDADFDVLISGAGSYGLAAAAVAKRTGRVGINLGGTTQLLFGIWGKRWDSYEHYLELRNRHWVRPLPSEVPERASTVEEGAYW